MSGLRVVVFDPVERTVTFHDYGRGERTLSLRRVLPLVGTGGNIWTVGLDQYFLEQINAVQDRWVTLSGIQATAMTNPYGRVHQQHPDYPTFFLFWSEAVEDHEETTDDQVSLVEVVFSEGKGKLILRDSYVPGRSIQDVRFVPTDGRPGLSSIAVLPIGAPAWLRLPEMTPIWQPRLFQTARGYRYFFEQEYDPDYLARTGEDGKRKVLDGDYSPAEATVIGGLTVGSANQDRQLIYRTYDRQEWVIDTTGGPTWWGYAIDEQRVWSSWDRMVGASLRAVLPPDLARYILRSTLPSPL